MSLLLSKEHGVNPSISTCFYCGEDDAIVLFGAGYRERDDDGVIRPKQAPMHIGVFSMDPCNKCREFMKQGIIFISAQDMGSVEAARLDYVARRDAMSDHDRKNCRPFIPNPYRTGGFWVLKEEAVRCIVPEGPLLEQMLRHRWTFIEEDAARQLGLYDQISDKAPEGHKDGAACGCGQPHG